MSRNYSSFSTQKTLTANMSNVTTTLNISDTTGFPSVPFMLVIDPDTASEEIVTVTSRAGSILTVTRASETNGAETDTAVVHTLGAVVKHMIVASDLQLVSTHTDDTTTAHGATGAVVGTTNTQTLTNKTVNLTSNTLTGTKAQFNTALSDDNFATIAGTETLTAKTLTSPTITSPTISGTITGSVVTSANIVDGAIVNADINVAAAIDWTKLAVSSTISATELGYLDGVTSVIQTQFSNIQTQFSNIVFDTDQAIIPMQVFG